MSYEPIFPILFPFLHLFPFPVCVIVESKAVNWHHLNLRNFNTVWCVLNLLCRAQEFGHVLLSNLTTDYNLSEDMQSARWKPQRLQPSQYEVKYSTELNQNCH